MRPSEFDPLFQEYAHRVDWQILKAQAVTESGLDPRAVSPAGAQGLCQFMPKTWAEWGEGSPFDPREAVRAQASYMDWLLDQFDGNLHKALAAYNWGIGNVKRCIVQYEEEWKDGLPAETNAYILKIERLLKDV